MRTVVGIATLALATTMFATPAFADAGGAAATATAAPAAPAASPEGDDGKKIGVGGDLLFTLPIGDMADGTGPLIGASLRGGYYVMPAFEAYLRVGYQMGLKKDQGGAFKTGVNNIPIYVGGRYFFMEPFAGLYGNLEIGANIMKGTVDPEPPGFSSKTNTRLGANVGAGYVISKDLPINIGVQFAIFNLLLKEDSSVSVGGTTVKIEEKTLMGINVLAGYEARF